MDSIEANGMTATDELRRLLDERGVEWEAWNDYITVVPPSTHYLEVSNGTLCVAIVDATPERAVAATLGPGTCRDLGGTGANGEQVFNCSECGCVLSLYDRDGSNNLCTSFVFDYPRYCPECGRKVSGDGQG